MLGVGGENSRGVKKGKERGRKRRGEEERDNQNGVNGKDQMHCTTFSSVCVCVCVNRVQVDQCDNLTASSGMQLELW